MTIWNLATEDALSEAVGRRLLGEVDVDGASIQSLQRGGSGYLKSRMKSWRQMAARYPVVIITDLDRVSCPVSLLEDWLGPDAVPPRLILRIAVREIESWLLADHVSLRRLLGAKARLPPSPDELPDPKQHLLLLAKTASREVREDLLKTAGAVSSQGIAYNARLVDHVANAWSPGRAAERSPSLRRARRKLKWLRSTV